MKAQWIKLFGRGAILMASFLVVFSVAADIILHPGYLTGTFTLGDYNVYSANVSATGGGYTASKSVTGDSYTLTVEGGDWDYSVGANIYVRPAGAYYPYTRVYFNNRLVNVPVGSTATNDYSFPDAATVRFQVNITGDAYSNWYGYGYALQNVDPSVGERTNSQSYTHSNYSSGNEWDMPVVPNENIRVYARVRVDNRWYNFWWVATDYLYENIGPGMTLIVPLNIEHTIVEPPPPVPPPEYDYGTLQGTVELGVSDPDALYRHRVVASGRRYYNQYLPLSANPAPYEFVTVQTEALAPYTYNLRAYSWFDNNQTYLQWPCERGDCSNNQVVLQANQTTLKDLVSDSGILSGTLKFTGTLANQSLSSTALYANTRRHYDPVLGWVNPPNYGGYAQHSKSGVNIDGTYRLFGQEGPWLPWRVNISKNENPNGSWSYFSLGINDYNYYYDGSTYDFGSASDIVAGTTLTQDREYCTGSVVVRFRDESGGLLSNPRLNAYGNRYNSSGQRELYASMSGRLSIRDALEPTIELHGPTADYNLNNISFQTQDGTYLTFPGFPITLECGVRKGVPISGKPRILVNEPPAYFLTNAQTVVVSGIAADDNGISSITVANNPVDFQITGNPDNEVGFSLELPVDDGTNTIVTTAIDVDGNVSFDERSIYIDRWLPTVNIDTPADGVVFAGPQATVPVDVTATDQGYGFTLKIYLDSELILEADGPGNESAAESLAVSEPIGPVSSGSHSISVEIADAAGNSASQTVNIVVNTAPVVNDDTYSTDEDAPLSVPAPGLLANDIDADGDSLTASVLTEPTQGAVAVSTDGSFLYTPNANYFGPDSFSYTIADASGGTDTAAVSLTVNAVNDLPVVTVGPDVTLECGDTYTGVGSFTDPDMDTWTAAVDYGDGSGVQTLALNVDKTFNLNHTYPGAGTYTVVASVTDSQGGQGVGSVAVDITATGAPSVTADLIPIGNGDEPNDDDEGRFIVDFSVSDGCSAVVNTQAVLIVAGWSTPIAVENGQVVEFEIEDPKEAVEVEWELEGGVSILEIEASALTLQVTATDSSGNSTVAEAVPTGLAPDNDDHDELD